MKPCCVRCARAVVAPPRLSLETCSALEVRRLGEAPGLWSYRTVQKRRGRGGTLLPILSLFSQTGSTTNDAVGKHHIKLLANNNEMLANNHVGTHREYVGYVRRSNGGPPPPACLSLPFCNECSRFGVVVFVVVLVNSLVLDMCVSNGVRRRQKAARRLFDKTAELRGGGDITREGFLVFAEQNGSILSVYQVCLGVCVCCWHGPR